MTQTAPVVPDRGGFPFLDITAPDFTYDAPEVAAARDRSWCAESPIGLLVLRHAEAQQLVRDPRLTHDGARFMAMSGVADGPVYDWWVPMMVNHDGVDHRRLRGLVQKAFTPRTLDRLRPFTRARARQLAGDLVGAGTTDFYAACADPLPLAVMSALLGVPSEDVGVFGTWTTDLGLVLSLIHERSFLDRVVAAVVGLDGYVDHLMDLRAAEPGEDVVSALVSERVAEGVVTREELRNLLVTLVFAAHDTTRHQLANAMVVFAEHPDQWRLLTRRPELVPDAVQELMRWAPSAASVFRFAGEDFEFGGRLIERDEFLLVLAPIVQRDPLAYRDGDAFDITATGRAPLIQFGGGPHHCLGAALARIELEEALAAMTAVLGPPVVTEPVTWRPPIGILGPTALSVRFESP
ncbi:cytochrome P450 [Actinokineospora auranticolor]|uniref:Cytochrome P450 n=1 Tax=Actinokineospora auranticolor TaxID=155976 RepID=A0A2S6H1K9_9PSEU|nr:cytochrome P450 [Actinokineospora auranticolor]PPK71378.1 hypothetical protein CLV40_101568 [Actinokineospora auranticolor]